MDREVEIYLRERCLKVMSEEFYEDMAQDVMELKRYEKADFWQRLEYLFTGKIGGAKHDKRK